MKKRIIAIYVEGGFELGLGNIYRMISLANGLKNSLHCNIFFVSPSDDYVIRMIEEQMFETVRTDKSSFRDILAGKKCDLVIFDKVNIDLDLIKNSKSLPNLKIVIFGNVSNANNYADLVVNAIIGSNFKIGFLRMEIQNI